MAFGLGAGACFYFVPMDGSSPSRFMNGRTSRLEEQFVELTGAPLELRTYRRPGRELGGGARDGLRRRAGAAAHRPLLPRPLREVGPLPGPRGRARGLRRRGRVPLRHRLRGAPDDDDREPRRGAPRAAPRVPARRATCSSPGTGSARSTRARRLPAAVARCAERMLEPPLGEYEGLPGLRRFAAEVGFVARAALGLAVVRAVHLPDDRAPRDRGRQLPADVLAVPRGGGVRGGALAATASERWTALAGDCSRRARRTSPSPALWAEIGAGAGAVLDAEERLWGSLSR